MHGMTQRPLPTVKVNGQAWKMFTSESYRSLCITAIRKKTSISISKSLNDRDSAMGELLEMIARLYQTPGTSESKEVLQSPIDDLE